MVPNRAKHHIFSIKKNKRQYHGNNLRTIIRKQPPSIETHLAVMRGQEVFTQVRQREELNRASQLKSSDQQIFSTTSSTCSTLIRQRLKRTSLVKAPLSVQRQSVYMLAAYVVTVRLLAATGWLPRLVRRKMAVLRTFTVGFEKVLGLYFTSRGSAQFN